MWRRILLVFAVSFFSWMLAVFSVLFCLRAYPSYAERDLACVVVGAITCVFSVNVIRFLILDYCRLKGGVAVLRGLLNSGDAVNQLLGMLALATVVGNRFGLSTTDSVHYWRAWMELDGSGLQWNPSLGRFVDPKYAKGLESETGANQKGQDGQESLVLAATRPNENKES